MSWYVDYSDYICLSSGTKKYNYCDSSKFYLLQKCIFFIHFYVASVALPLSIDAVTPSQKATRLVKQDLPLMKPCWFSCITSLSSMCLIINSWRICSMIFPCTEGRLDRMVVPRIIHFVLLKNGSKVSFCSVTRDFTYCHDFSNIESGLVTTSANSLRTLGCISLGPIDLWMFRFLMWS